MIQESKLNIVKKAPFVLPFRNIDKSKLTLVGGKGANLAELSNIRKIRVPGGFVVTTEAYKTITENNRQLSSLLDELAHLNAGDRENSREVSAKIRSTIESISIPGGIAEEIAVYLHKFGEKDALRCGRALRRKTCPRHPSRDNRIRI